MNLFTFTHFGTTYQGYLDTRHRYADNNNTVCQLFSRGIDCENDDDPFELYATLSVNTDVRLPAGSFVFKTYSENAGLYEEMLKNKLIKPTICSVACGFAGQQPIVKLEEIADVVEA